MASHALEARKAATTVIVITESDTTPRKTLSKGIAALANTGRSVYELYVSAEKLHSLYNGQKLIIQ